MTENQKEIIKYLKKNGINNFRAPKGHTWVQLTKGQTIYGTKLTKIVNECRIFFSGFDGTLIIGSVNGEEK